MYLDSEKVAISFHYGGDNSFIQVNKQRSLALNVITFDCLLFEATITDA